jgi:hypothetical protein
MPHAYACYGVSLQLGRLKSQRPAHRPGPHLQLGRLNRVAGATRLGLVGPGGLHLQQAQILNPSSFNSQSGSNLPGSCPQPSPGLVGGTGSLGAHRPEPRSMPCAIVVGSRPQPRGCLQGLQPSRHPHVHLNPPVLHCMATTFSVTRGYTPFRVGGQVGASSGEYLQNLLEPLQQGPAVLQGLAREIQRPQPPAAPAHINLRHLAHF